MAVLAGCDGDGDDSCGPGDEPAPGLVVEAGGITFGELAASPNNDCPPPEGGPTSITIQGGQIDPAVDGQFLVLCLPRPDQIGDAPIRFSDTDRVQIVDFFGQDADGCAIRFDRAAAIGDGAATFSGFCEDGTSSAGFALTLSGTLPFTRTCDGEEPSAITSELGGRAAVTAAPL